jgi:hypothetical protein
MGLSVYFLKCRVKEEREEVKRNVSYSADKWLKKTTPDDKGLTRPMDLTNTDKDEMEEVVDEEENVGS